MRRAACFVTVTLCGAVAFGQGLLDCIEPDVLRALVLQGQGEPPPVITAAMPRELSAVRMPAEFTWIGSAERALARLDASATTSQVTAAWRSSLAPDAARTAAASALAAEGWALQDSGMATAVFRSALPAMQSACRNGQQAGITASTMEGATYVLLTLQRGNDDASACSQVRPTQRLITGVEAYLPRLDMPIDPATGQVARSNRTDQGSRSGMVDARVEFASRDSSGNVARHFAKQLAEQGWSSDAAWNGATTAGSSWSRRDGDVLIHGMLQLITVADGKWRAELRITRLP
jgi:hypothetical protein